MTALRLLTWALWLAAGACVAVPPHTPAPTLPEEAPLGARANVRDGDWPTRDWWRQYADPALDGLIARALEGSPDLALVQARVDGAVAGVRAAAATAGFTVDASADATRARLSDNGLLPAGLFGYHWYSVADLGLGINYTFDWWGREAARVRAAGASAHASEAERSAARLALTSAVAVAYFGWQSDCAHEALLERRMESLEGELALIERRERAGLTRADEAERTRAALAQARDSLGAMRKSEAMRLIALAALTGTPPAELPTLTARSLPAPGAAVPERLSIDLLARRPDVAASRWRVESARADVEEARAGFMPDVSLSALLGLSSREIGKLLEAGSADPNVTAAVHLPLFDAGRLRAAHDASRARLAESIATYRKAVIDAATEVNTDLENRYALARQLELRTTMLDSAAKLRDLAARRADAGLSDERPRFEAEIARLGADDAILDTRYAQLTTDLALIRALGGGYTTDDAHE